MILDTRRDSYSPPQRVFRVEHGCELFPRYGANSSTDIAVNIKPGIVVVDSHPIQFGGRLALAVHSGTLTDGHTKYTAVIAYWNPLTSRAYLLAVEGTSAASGAAAPTDTEIEAELPDSSYPYTVLGVVAFSRSSSTITYESFDHTKRSFGVAVAEKTAVAAAGQELDVVGDNAALYRPWGKLRFAVDAANIADGDILTDLPLPLIYGRIRAWRAVCEKAITTAAKTTTPHLEIGSTTVTGTDGTAYASTKALGTVTTLGAPTALNTFKPGDVASIVAASTTAFVEGRIAFEIDIEELVF